MAEALHSFGDLLSDFITLYAYRLARYKASPSYPYGYGKIEPLGGLVVSGLLAGGGVGMGIHSYQELKTMLFTESSSTIDAVATVALQNELLNLISLSPYAVLILVGSIGVKELLYRMTLKVGLKTKSSVLIANAYHHRSDVVTSIVALIGVGGAAVGVPILDPIGGLVVSGMILKMGIETGIPSLKELIDIAVPEATLTHVQKALVDIQV